MSEPVLNSRPSQPILGPWFVRQPSSEGRPYVQTGEPHFTTVAYNVPDQPTARLIADAPRLHDENVQLESERDEWYGRAAKLQAALYRYGRHEPRCGFVLAGEECSCGLCAVREGKT